MICLECSDTMVTREAGNEIYGDSHMVELTATEREWWSVLLCMVDTRSAGHLLTSGHSKLMDRMFEGEWDGQCVWLADGRAK